MSAFTPLHRSGSGEPLVLLHGSRDTWRTWELVLPSLERHHDVLAPTLAGHAGGPPLDDDVSVDAVLAALERTLDDAGFATAHFAGNSLGGWLSLHLAARGRARSVVALAPAGGWAPGDESWHDVLGLMADNAVLTRDVVEDASAIPPELLEHQMWAARRTDPRLVEHALRIGFPPPDAARIDCPVRVVWGTRDRLLPWPSAAARYRTDLLPHADWVELDGVGHCPQLEVPLETAQLILGVTTG